MPDTTVASSTGADDPSVPTRLLVLGLAHRNGDILTSELWPVTEACGLTADQVRSCLRRLVAEGLFTRDGEGRDAVLKATPEGTAALGSMMARHVLAYAQDAAGRGWDRRWRLAAFAIPESKRAARDVFRDRLLALGAAPIHNGLYVSPHRWEAEVVDEAERLGIVEHVSMATTDDLSVGGVTDPRALAVALWPLERIAERYRDFIDTYRDVPDNLDDMRRRGERLSEADFLPGALNIAIRFNQCFELDPMLPPELLPKPWPGREAREILTRCRRLGVLARQDKSGPALFRVFDDVIATLP
ncbi:MAG: PaaX family transcriptional regulator C-terminal domain-containing protein [Acidimicrobiales bacterium]